MKKLVTSKVKVSSIVKFAFWHNIWYNSIWFAKETFTLKRRVTYILKKKIIYYTKKLFKRVNILFLLLISIVSVITFKYKPTYAVSVSGNVIGYVNSKVELEERINNEILAHKGNVAFVTMNAVPNIELEFVSGNVQTNEDEILEILKKETETTYKYYAVAFNNETKAYVNTLEEAQEIVAEIKQEHSNNPDLNIGISEYYTINIDDAQKIDENTNIEVAKQNVENSINEYIIREARTINGVYLETTPVNGVITSRFASIESVRYGAHTGLDIGAASGTKIQAAAGGTVKHASWMGSYGNLVIISHGNGIETYYAHCSKILVSVGTQVNSGDTIALVGSTGNSTGPHLHFEVRTNGTPVNPQNYLYRNY